MPSWRRFSPSLILFSIAATLVTGAVNDPYRAVKIRVRNSAGQSIRGAYVALVPAWRPTQRPLAEAISEGDVTVLRVPAGDYRIIAGAPGYAMWSRQPVTVRTSELETEIALPDLRAISGTVRDERGTPLAGAHVSTMQGITPAGLGTLSPLATRHLAGGWSTTTDTAGRWTLRIPTDPTLLVTRLAHYADSFDLRPAGPGPVDVSLTAGGTVVAAVDRLDPAVVLTLTPDPPEKSAVSAEVLSRVWSRWADTRELQWDSMPSGRYALFARYAAPNYFMQRAERVGTVDINNGQATRINAKLPAPRVPEQQAEMLYVPVRRAELGDVTAFDAKRDGQADRVDAFAEEVIGGTVIHLHSAPGSGPFVIATTQAIYSSPAKPDQQIPEEPSLATRNERADAAAHLNLPGGVKAFPASGVATFRDCADGLTLRTPIDVKRDGHASFVAPALCGSAALDFPPYEITALDQRLVPGEQSLGEIQLRAGGSFEVSVVRRSRGETIAAESATVRVSLKQSDGRPATVLREIAASDDGVFRATGLPSEQLLLVSAATSSDARSDEVSISLSSGEHRILDPLVVLEPATVIVKSQIDEAIRERYPASRLAAILLAPLDPARRSEAMQQDADGQPARFEGVHRGQWMVRAWAELAGIHSLLTVATLQVEPGEVYTVDDPVKPSVFEGIVLEEGRGVEAKVVIGVLEKQAHFVTDRQGQFRAVLDQSGPHPVAVARIATQSNLIPIGDVDFSDSGRRVEIRIPGSTSVSVRARSNGKPVVGRTVWLSRQLASGLVDEATRRGRVTDDDGDVRFEDVAPGDWIFTLSADGRRAQKLVHLESEKSATVELTLTDAASIRGIVRSATRQPLRGARIDCAFIGAVGVVELETAATAVDGSFSIERSGQLPTPAVCTMVSSAGEVDAFIALPDEDTDVSLSSSVGSLELRSTNGALDVAALWAISGDGRAIHLAGVATKLGMFATLSVPSWPAGDWSLVRARSSSELQTVATRRGLALPSIERLRVRAGERAVIEFK